MALVARRDDVEGERVLEDMVIKGEVTAEFRYGQITWQHTNTTNGAYLGM